MSRAKCFPSFFPFPIFFQLRSLSLAHFKLSQLILSSCTTACLLLSSFYSVFSLPQISTDQNGQIPQPWSTSLSSSSLICFQNLTLPHFQSLYFSKMSLLSHLLGHFNLILLRLPGGSKKPNFSLFLGFLLFCICHIFIISFYYHLHCCLIMPLPFLFFSIPFFPFSSLFFLFLLFPSTLFPLLLFCFLPILNYYPNLLQVITSM